MIIRNYNNILELRENKYYLNHLKQCKWVVVILRDFSAERMNSIYCIKNMNSDCPLLVETQLLQLNFAIG